MIEADGSRRVRKRSWDEIESRLLYDLLKLRVDVFVVEQACPYPELDGRDLEPGALHWWTEDPAGRPTSYLRTLEEGDGTLRIGRVCTRADARGGGLAGDLMTAVLQSLQGPREVVLHAQAHLQGWYGRYGFTPDGAEYLDDGIPHVPMCRRIP